MNVYYSMHVQANKPRIFNTVSEVLKCFARSVVECFATCSLAVRQNSVT